MPVITALVASFLAILYIRLSLNVVKLRHKHKLPLGDGGIEEIQRAIRAHGNFGEYVPIALILLLCLELNQAPALLVGFLGLLLIAGRLIHHRGVSRHEQTYSQRVRGMQLTFGCLALAAVSNLVVAGLRLLPM